MKDPFPIHESATKCASIEYNAERLRETKEQQIFLLKLSDALRALADPVAIQEEAARLLGEYLDADRTYYALVDWARGIAVIERNYVRGAVPSVVGEHFFADFTGAEQAYRVGKVFVINDVEDAQFSPPADLPAYRALSIRSILSAPLIKDGVPVASMTVLKTVPYSWSRQEILLFEDVATRTWSAVERARAEEALRDSDARFRALALANSGIIYRMSADWSDMLSLQSKNLIIETEVPRSNWLEVYIPADEQHRIMEAVRAGMRAQKSVIELEHRIIGVDRKERWVLSRAVPFINKNNEITEWFGTALDITERRHVEQTLKEADRRKDEFLAILAHELRNPLFPIKNAIYLLQQKNVDYSQLIQIMQRQINHMICLIDDLLEASRIATGKIELRKEDISLIEIIDNALEVSKSLLKNNHHQLIVSLPSEVCFINADMIRMTQIFANLLNNAAKYTPENGKIKIHAYRQNDKIIISIRDNGIGITSELLPHIFEMFTQGQHINPNNKGLGVGLAMVRSLIELHEGTVKAYSEGPNQGSEFIVCLPLATDTKKKFEHEANIPEKKPSFAHLRILIVDDNPDIIDSFAMLLNCWDITVHTASNGKSALAILDEFNPHLVLLDIGMPEMGGYEVAEKIRQNPKYESIKLVALTGWSQEKDRAKSLASGFNEHLTKPLDIDALKQILNTLS